MWFEWPRSLKQSFSFSTESAWVLYNTCSTWGWVATRHGNQNALKVKRETANFQVKGFHKGRFFPRGVFWTKRVTWWRHGRASSSKIRTHEMGGEFPHEQRPSTSKGNKNREKWARTTFFSHRLLIEWRQVHRPFKFHRKSCSTHNAIWMQPNWMTMRPWSRQMTIKMLFKLTGQNIRFLCIQWFVSLCQQFLFFATI